MSDHPSLSPKCPHGVLLEYARCNRCEDPAFDAAQQPPVNWKTLTIGGQAPVLTKNELRRLANVVVLSNITETDAVALSKFLRELADEPKAPPESPCACVGFCAINSKYGGILAAGIYCAAKRAQNRSGDA